MRPFHPLPSSRPPSPAGPPSIAANPYPAFFYPQQVYPIISHGISVTIRVTLERQSYYEIVVGPHLWCASPLPALPPSPPVSGIPSGYIVVPQKARPRLFSTMTSYLHLFTSSPVTRTRFILFLIFVDAELPLEPSDEVSGASNRSQYDEGFNEVRVKSIFRWCETTP